jgi:hypothetical protein
MKKEGIEDKIKKLLVVLQNKDGKDYFICTIFISKMGLINCVMDIAKKEITDFKKKSLMDMIRRVK